jgi:flavin reductase (DIM6/NTAB) family NADH-FMN oxidoreductase RutF
MALKKYNAQDLLAMEQRKRATFINSMAGVKSAVLVGTAYEKGQTNLAIFNSLIHIGANPPYYGLLFRPDTVRRDTLQNITTQKEYTINLMPADFAEQAHQTSAKYGPEESEFKAVGLQEYFVEGFSAPFVQEALIRMGLRLEEKIEIAVNKTLLVIGSIQYIEMDQSMVDETGFVNLSSTLACAGLDAYYKADLLKRLAYAKPELPPREL